MLSATPNRYMSKNPNCPLHLHTVPVCFVLLFCYVHFAEAQTCAVTGSITCSGPCACPNADPIPSLTNPVFFEDGYDWEYPDNLVCEWTIESNAVINIYFVFMDMEVNYDFVRVSMCTTSSCATSQALGSFDQVSRQNAGGVSNNPANFPFMRISMTSDAESGGSGFRARWHLNTVPFFCLCGANTYRETPDVCTLCPTNSNSPVGSTIVTACVCDAGSTGPDGGACTQCVAGKYKSVTGNATCTNCLAGEYSTTVGATSNMCSVCGANSNSPVGSAEIAACQCNAWYTGANGGTCTHCPAGKNTAGRRGQDECVDCLAAGAAPSATTNSSSSSLAACLEHYMQHAFGAVATDTAIRASLMQLDVPSGAVVRIAEDSAQSNSSSSSTMNSAAVLRCSGGGGVDAAKWYPANINPDHRAGNIYTLSLPPHNTEPDSPQQHLGPDSPQQHLG